MKTDQEVRDAMEHARQNAAAGYDNIREMVAALDCDYDRLQELKDERADLASEAEDDTNAAIQEARAALAEWDEENGEELKELQEAAGEFENREDAEQRIQEDPLSVEVRSGWYTPGSDGEATQPEEFKILLTTGGPALQIRGELDSHLQPCRAWLEMQDWGTPWTEYHGEYNTDSHVSQDVLLTYCQQFYFGE